MKLTVKELTLQNFKGQNTNFQFSDNTYLLGANGSGKTTQYDAFLWLLFGKDSMGRTDYKIKPLLPDWTEQHHVTVSVQGIFDIDGQELILKRIYTEKWPKKKGSEEAEYDGDKTDYEYNGVPCNMTEYKARISKIVDETRFRLITSASYFNSMGWKDRRDILLQAAGELTNDEVAGSDKAFLDLLNLCSGKLLEDYRKEVANKKKPIKKELDGIPFAIEEIKNQIFIKDWSTLENSLSEKESQIKSLRDGIDSESQRLNEANKETNLRIQSLYSEISSLEKKKNAIEAKFKAEYNNQLSDLDLSKSKLRNKISTLQSGLANLTKTESTLKAQIASLSESRNKLGEQYIAIKNGKLEDKDKICPACKRAFEGHDLEALIKNLLGAVSTEGFSIKDSIEKYNTQLEETIKQIKEHESGISESTEGLKLIESTQIKHFVSSTNEDREYKEVLKAISDKKEMIDLVSESAEKPVDASLAKEQISALTKEINAIRQELYGKKIVENNQARLVQLDKKKKELSVDLALYERIEINADRFIKRKLDMMESKVNSMFSLVKWRMYEPQVNGGEKEICECGIDGVTFGSLNNALKVNAGLDIANAFSRINNVYAPIWIDNRESVTDIIPVESQTISLVVSPDHKVLTIKN